MYLEAVRLYADWLAGTLKDWQAVDQGVNALKAGTPRFAGDPEPPAVTVEDETRHGQLARNRPTSVVPGLGVRLYQPIQRAALPATAFIDADDVELAAMLFLDAVDTQAGVRDELYLVRTICRSTRQFARNENAQRREANSIKLVTCTGIRIFPRQPISEEDTHVVTAVVSTWKVRDLAP